MSALAIGIAAVRRKMDLNDQMSLETLRNNFEAMIPLPRTIIRAFNSKDSAVSSCVCFRHELSIRKLPIFSRCIASEVRWSKKHFIIERKLL